jgi:integrase
MRPAEYLALQWKDVDLEAGTTPQLTMIFQAGENPKMVSERLGHSNIALTLDVYTHVLPDMQHRRSKPT